MIALLIVAVLMDALVLWFVWPVPGDKPEEPMFKELRFRWWYLRWTFSEYMEIDHEIIGYSWIYSAWCALKGTMREIGNSREVYAVWSAPRDWYINAEGVYTEIGK